MRPPCTVHFLAVVNCDLEIIYSFFKNGSCKTVKKWYTDITETEKGGAQHGTHQRASGDQNHRHQP